MRKLVDERRRQIAPQVIHLVPVGDQRGAVMESTDGIPRAVPPSPTSKVAMAKHNNGLSSERRRIGVVRVSARARAVIASLEHHPLANWVIDSVMAAVKLDVTIAFEVLLC